MASPVPTTNPAEFGSFPNYLAARVGGLRAARGLSRTQSIGRAARTDMDEDGGEESFAIDKTENAVNPSADSLRELQIDLLGADI